MKKRPNSFYIFVAVLFVSLLTINNRYFKGSSSFLGVTYSKNYKINAEKSAVIDGVYVVPGQTIQPGDLLVTLSSQELTLEIQKLEKEVELLTSEKLEKQKLLESEIQLLESEKRIIRNDIESEVSLIKNRINLNRSLTNEILSEQNSSISQDSLTTLELQIRSIRAKGLLEIEAVNIKEQDLRQDHEFDQSQIQARIDLAQQELDWKLEEDERLNKYATFAGVVENVYVKEGEQIEAFTSVVSVNPLHPTSAVGYLVGKKDRDKSLGETVTIQALEHNELFATGRIIGFGSVVELPEILQKSTSVKAFGLEVFIEIPDQNGLPVGEKIIIK
ncbi:MAG: biotin/lipoyl-binding protein [Balneolaceae bacterium]|nr:biotin/lipoyl-binding protein [Balneolaceae bacterium]MBO6544972.1 biotin/lipoyl-binding protein [Balneolaceae bacterium]MBO6646368.1 biotin/lipoyl-binding protein [Balneolaceae bacterium]